MIKHLSFLKVQVIFTGPYSYSTAPCELVFSQFKRGEHNPEGLSTGKK